MPGDVRMADHWGIKYKHVLTPGKGNLACLEQIKLQRVPNDIPIVWVYTEPGRDYGRVTGNPEFDWIKSEDIFSIRKQLDAEILATIRKNLKNPIGLIGGLADINIELAESLGFHIIHPSWQQWIAQTLDRTKYFKFGWGACDIGWRMDYNNVKPSKTAVFAWDELIKEWCMWAELGYFCHEHPTPRANLEFANYLKKDVIKWINNVKK